MLHCKSIMANIIRGLCSIKFTLCLIFILILTCILATLMPKVDIYNSWLFVTLLVCLFINLFLFIINRFSIRTKSPGTIIIHLSIMLILTGGLVGALWGKRGDMGIREGEARDSFYTETDNVITESGIPFKIRLVDFTLETYEQDESQIKDFKSLLEIIEGDSVVLSKTIEVNDPLKYKGFAIYQANYNPEDLAWSGLHIKKDPGIGIVYAGFILLISGITYILFIKPVDKI